MVNDVFYDGGSEQSHTVSKPRGATSAMERQVGGSGPFHRVIVSKWSLVNIARVVVERAGETRQSSSLYVVV